MAARRLAALTLTEAERTELTALAARPKTAQVLAQRARIVLACADGLENKMASLQLGVHAMTVGKWRRRFLDQRVEGLRDEARSGAPRTIDDERIEAVITRTLESQPDAATHCSARGMAHDSGLSVSTVQRIWRAFGLKPHRQETFKVSTDAARPAGAAQPRLRPAWDDLAVRRARCRHRTGDRPMLSASSGRGIPSVPRRTPIPRAARSRRASDLGQLCHAQDRADPRLAGEASALARASDPNQQFLAEPGRALLCHTHRQANPPRCSSQRRGTRSRHHGLPRPP